MIVDRKHHLRLYRRQIFSVRYNRPTIVPCLERDPYPPPSNIRLVQGKSTLQTASRSVQPVWHVDRKHHLRVYRRSMVGSEMVGWLVECFPSLVRSRAQSVGVWQALLEEGVLVHGSVCLRSICQIAINSSKSL